ncbi:MAG: hypothetical protein JW839_10150 [Candidatus Lokiarchaeota archaeon]|nr:hypothetical protein [Candidatus Lokiarchaeota archaeon]
MSSSDSPALTISFRLRNADEREILVTKAKQSRSNVTNFLRGCIFGSAKNDSLADMASSKALVDDMTFMFRFFQKNARNLDITGQEKERFNAILKKLREMAANEP